MQVNFGESKIFSPENHIVLKIDVRSLKSVSCPEENMKNNFFVNREYAGNLGEEEEEHEKKLEQEYLLNLVDKF
jgi:hypothetical protein